MDGWLGAWPSQADFSPSQEPVWLMFAYCGLATAPMSQTGPCAYFAAADDARDCFAGGRLRLPVVAPVTF